jgi:hypothetical protein
MTIKASCLWKMPQRVKQFERQVVEIQRFIHWRSWRIEMSRMVVRCKNMVIE